MRDRPRIAIVMGDPAGIGPELAVKLLARPETSVLAEVSVLADESEVLAAAAEAGVVVPIGARGESGAVSVLDDGTAPTAPIPRRATSVEAGRRVMHQLQRALAMARAGEIDGILFTPLNKTSLKLAGMHHEDELRWFAEELGYDGFTSELNVLDFLTTARVTSHIPLSDVAGRITRESVLPAIRLLDRVLRESGIAEPRLGVCALNPHGGENGNFGRQEIDEIGPAVADAVAEGIRVRGPFPSDTVFVRARRGEFDGVVTMYHDQGQIAMKLLGFDTGVTIQGGLPVVIATPAHGTAFDIAGQGVADVGPTVHAFELVVAIVRRSADRRRG